MTVQKRSSGKAAVECKWNPVQRRWRCRITVGRDHVGPLFVRVPDDIGDEGDAADDAARQALARAVERGLVAFDDLEHDGGTFEVHGEHDRKKRAASTDRTAKAKATAKDAAPVRAERKTKRTASVDRKPRVERNARVERRALAAAKPTARTAPKPKPKRLAPPMGAKKANKIIGNGRETRALEEHYRDVKDEYHNVGEALRERHLAVAAIAGQPR